MKKFIATIVLLISLTLAGSSAHAASMVAGCPVGYNCIPIVQTTAPVCPQGYTCRPISNTTSSAGSYVPGSYYNSYFGGVNNNTTAGAQPQAQAQAQPLADSSDLSDSVLGPSGLSLAADQLTAQPVDTSVNNCSADNSGTSTPFSMDGNNIISGKFTMHYNQTADCRLNAIGIGKAKRGEDLNMGLLETLAPVTNNASTVLDFQLIPLSFGGSIASPQIRSSCQSSTANASPNTKNMAFFYCVVRALGYRPATSLESLAMLSKYVTNGPPGFSSMKILYLQVSGAAVEIVTPPVSSCVGTVCRSLYTSGVVFTPSVSVPPGRRMNASGQYDVISPGMGIGPAKTFWTTSMPGQSAYTYTMIVSDPSAPLATTQKIDALPTTAAMQGGGSSMPYYVSFTPDSYEINSVDSNGTSKKIKIEFLKITAPYMKEVLANGQPGPRSFPYMNPRIVKKTVDDYITSKGLKYREANVGELTALFNQVPNIAIPKSNDGSGTVSGHEYIMAFGEPMNSCGGWPMIYSAVAPAVLYTT
ncbi:MAG: hypothetical protein WCK03_04250, partial [Candidatus Taylorbacteria bacterium]